MTIPARQVILYIYCAKLPLLPPQPPPAASQPVQAADLCAPAASYLHAGVKLWAFLPAWLVEASPQLLAWAVARQARRARRKLALSTCSGCTALPKKSSACLSAQLWCCAAVVLRPFHAPPFP